MNLDHLYYFRTLVELKSRSKAAERLSITPSTLSLAISKLERELGVPLIEKKRGSVDLTSDGQAFYEYVATALQFLDGGMRVLRERRGGGHSKRNHHWHRLLGSRSGVVEHRQPVSRHDARRRAYKREAVVHAGAFA